jgi:hypothetical protein
MNIELQKDYLESIERMQEKDRFSYLLFCSFENDRIIEIGWERTLSANNIQNFLLEYMIKNRVDLVAENGHLIFKAHP